MTMDEPRHLDGNAIGGILREVFGGEMTAAQGCCATCGSVSAMATLVVFRSGPGDVLCCPACTGVVAVIITLPQGPRVHLAALRWLEPPR
jgi:hypothetical protein